MTSSYEKPKPGDLIEIIRIGYEHWALYVGDGYVIHLAAPDGFPGAASSSVLSCLTTKAVVKRELLKDVVAGCNYQVNNDLDKKCRPLPVRQIISNAMKEVGKKVDYRLLSNNCEHFVTRLRYGKPLSLQVENAEKNVSLGTMSLGLGGILLAIFATVKAITT